MKPRYEAASPKAYEMLRKAEEIETEPFFRFLQLFITVYLWLREIFLQGIKIPQINLISFLK